MTLKKTEWSEWRLAALFMFTHTVTADSSDDGHSDPLVKPCRDPASAPLIRPQSNAGGVPAKKLAGEVGIEPTNAGIKIRCLTAWRLPKLLFDEIMHGMTIQPLRHKPFHAGWEPG